MKWPWNRQSPMPSPAIPAPTPDAAAVAAIASLRDCARIEEGERCAALAEDWAKRYTLPTEAHRLCADVLYSLAMNLRDTARPRVRSLEASLIGGPADGMRMKLTRTPIYLRVTSRTPQPNMETWEPLDRVTDTPSPASKVYVYRKVSDGDESLKNVVNATYAYVAVQPSDGTLRSTDAWREWCKEQAERELGRKVEIDERGNAK